MQVNGEESSGQGLSFGGRRVGQQVALLQGLVLSILRLVGGPAGQ